MFLFFIMLTGYLMSKKELSPKYYCGIVKTLATYVLASIACIIFKNLYMGGAYGVKESILDFSATKLFLVCRNVHRIIFDYSVFEFVL